MNEKIRNFRDLNVWKLGIEIVEDIYRLTKEFPPDEVYGLTAQMRRSAETIQLLEKTNHLSRMTMNLIKCI